MKTDANCIFCEIVAGQIPCFKLLEDDDTLAFMDIYPASDGHCAIGFGQSAADRAVLAKGAAGSDRNAIALRRWCDPCHVAIAEGVQPGQ